MPINVEVPSLGESVREAVLVKWHKADGDAVETDEPLCELETDKANVDVPSPAKGVLRRAKDEGDTVSIGEVVARIDESGAGQTNGAEGARAPAKGGATAAEAAAPRQAVPASAPAAGASGGGAAAPAGPEDMRPSVRRIVAEQNVNPADLQGTGPRGMVTKEDATRAAASTASAATAQAPAREPAAGAPRARQTREADAIATDAAAAPTSTVPVQTRQVSSAGGVEGEGIKRVPMSKIRKRIAENLVRAQQTAAILTTFNEVDMQSIFDLRAKYKEQFEKVHGVGLGFMSFFARAVVLGLREFPRVNAQLDGDDIVYHGFVNLGIAVSTERGLAVPVLRNVERMSFAQIESEIKRLAAATRDGKLGLQELSGGTFTITNGGVFGSLLSTPIINPPQAAILGMHAIQKRPVVINDQVVVRPMMYVALSYDHRLIDGRESVSFLVRVKQLLEDPARLMLEV